MRVVRVRRLRHRSRIIHLTRSRTAKQMGLADAPMMPVATLTNAELIHVTSVAQELPIADRAAIPVARGTKHMITDEAPCRCWANSSLSPPVSITNGLLRVLHLVKGVRVDPYLDGLVTVHQMNNSFLRAIIL